MMRSSTSVRALIVALLTNPVGFVGRTAAQQDSLDLAAALRLAREHSAALSVADAAVEGAEGATTTADAARLPRVSAQGLYLRYQDPLAVELGPLGAFEPVATNTYVVGLQATVPVYTSGRLSAAVRAAKATAHGARLTREQAEVDLTAAVAHAYDDVLLAGAMGEVAEESTDVLRHALTVARSHYDEGTAARLDVLRAETRLSSAEARLRAARDRRQDAKERLATVIGLDPADLPPVSGRLELDTIEARALKGEAPPDRPLTTPRIAALQATAAAARAREQAARATGRPAVQAFVTGFTSRPELLTGKRQWAWEILGGVSVSWPFFDGGKAKGRARMSAAVAEGASAQAEEDRRKGAAAVRTQYRAMARALQDVQAGTENIDRAERTLSIAEDRYAGGIGIQLDVLDAEAELAQVRAERLRAVYAYRSAIVELRRALGLPADARLEAPGER